jgi:hypothetical protein
LDALEGPSLGVLGSVLNASFAVKVVMPKEMEALVTLGLAIAEWQRSVDAVLKLPCRTPLPFDVATLEYVRAELLQVARTQRRKASENAGAGTAATLFGFGVVGGC